MWFFRAMVAMLVGAFLLYGGSVAWAMMPAKQKEVRGARMDGLRNAGRVTITAPAEGRAVRKVTEFVKKIEGGVLYTEGGQYRLSRVKVVDLTQGRKDVVKAGSRPKKTAEMTFLNNQLHEVVIRQRR